ncbi:unnamed protein product [Porites lobata]|uniref:Uncharacterized protein n=1 Tax=Porites lobata TaxID=104759 RepID=A0ABN8S293_9CNID|nr:unnamed protein product [Porites lobata]
MAHNTQLLTKEKGSRAHKKGRAKNYVIHIASGYLAVNIVSEMKSLLFLLFLGAIVATLAEESFEDEAVAELLDEQGDETIAELADEANDPHHRPRPSGPPRACKLYFKKCLKKPTGPRPTRPIKKKICQKLRKMCQKLRPSRRPKP